MQSAVEKCWELTGQPVLSRSFWDDAAGRFAVGKFRNAADFLAQDASRARALYEACDRLAASALESFLYWRATQVYRLECVKALLPFSPVVAGDKHWSAMLGEGGWSWAGPLNYYSDLPGFYSSTRMNFNTTSLQMRGAMNQRVFDVPAAGGFLLTDYASQLEEAFVPGHEVVCYHHPCEIAELVRYFLSRPDHCRKITTRARERIMRQHTYAHRVRTMCAFMHQTYGTPACAS
jgi:spore maturation protein CgeB